MTFQDTYKFGQVVVASDSVMAYLEDREDLSDEVKEILEIFDESPIEFTFDDDWDTGCMYRVDGLEVPLILLETFGGYPGEPIDVANAQAAKEWASERSHIYAFTSTFAGCEMVELYFDATSATTWDAEEAIELIDSYRGYPVLDEDLWSEIEGEFNDEAMKNVLEWEEQEREIKFTDDQRNLITELYWNEWEGYYEAGYVQEDKLQEIIDDVLSGNIQEHQETKLW